MKRSEIIFTLLAIPLDALMVFLAFLSAYGLRSQTEILQVVYLWPYQDYIHFVAWMLPFWVIIFALSGLYSVRTGGRRWGEFTKIFLAVSASVMFFVAWVFLSRTLFFSRLIVIYAWVMAIGYVSIGRYLLGLTQRFLFRFGVGLRNVVIVGSDETAQTLKRELTTNTDLGYRVVNGLIKPSISEIKEFLIAHPTVDEMIVAESELSTDKTLELISLCEEHGITFRLVPNLFEVKSTNIEVQTLAAVPVIEYRRTPLTATAGIVKRIVDVILSAIALLLLSPLFVLISILIKLDSQGPVYYRHKRLGQGKKEFYLFKFRSMATEFCTGDDYKGRTNEEALANGIGKPELYKEFVKEQKLKDDPRVTRIGSFLRKTSLDELPQFFNVFLGQLSMVGPRPIVTDELEKYGDYKHRLFIVKPGVTGLWQVSGRSDMPYNERVKLDMYYIENWSLWSDFVIMMKTAIVMISRKNAY
jgi:exopolysaccharide biosynthesis polyprenyl glycosylphosphotransferase